MKLAAFLLLATAAVAQSPKRLYVEERIVERRNFFTGGADAIAAQNGTPIPEHKRNVSAEVSRDILQSCPSAVVITDNEKDASAYKLRIYPSASKVIAANGDIVYISPAKKGPAELSKDVCRYFSSLH